MAALLTLEEALAHLKSPLTVATMPPETAADLQLKLDAAHAVVLSLAAQRVDGTAAARAAEVAAWDASTAPPEVKLAILMIMAEHERYRGDEERPSKDPHGVDPRVKALLQRQRDPGLA